MITAKGNAKGHRKEIENNKMCYVSTIAASWTTRRRCTGIYRFAVAIIRDIRFDCGVKVLGKLSS